jgi:hypothetical protein
MSDLLYVARPIDHMAGADGTFLNDITQAVLKHAVNARFGLYRPELAFNVQGILPQPWLRMINNTALLFSDAVLAIWPHDAKSWGVPAEVERTVTLDKPVLILTNGKPTWSMIDEKIQIMREGEPDEMVRAALQWLRLKVDEKKAANK